MGKITITVLAGWLLAALLVSASGWVAALRPPWPQVVLFSLAALQLLVFAVCRPWRQWLLALPAPFLIAPHLTRFVGVVFLLLRRCGELPFAFAVPGGIGDILVALGAATLLAGRVQSPVLIQLWNTLGLVDILFVVFTASRLALADPSSMSALLRFPLALLPTFVVPIVIFSHLVIAIRWRRPVPEKGL